MSYLFAMNQQHHIDSNADFTISCAAVGERSVESLAVLQVIFFFSVSLLQGKTFYYNIPSFDYFAAGHQIMDW